MKNKSSTIRISTENKERLRKKFGDQSFNSIIEKNLIEKEDPRYKALTEAGQIFFEHSRNEFTDIDTSFRLATLITEKDSKQFKLNIVAELFVLHHRIGKLNAEAKTKSKTVHKKTTTKTGE